MEEGSLEYEFNTLRQCTPCTLTHTTPIQSQVIPHSLCHTCIVHSTPPVTATSMGCTAKHSTSHLSRIAERRAGIRLVFQSQVQRTTLLREATLAVA